MNLQPLFETQKTLDDRIEKEKGLEGQDLLDKKILALQVELGELANEWRGFKFWSENQEPNTDICSKCDGKGMYTATVNNLSMTGKCNNCYGKGKHFDNPLLEEYVDCLHFILSIGYTIGRNYFVYDEFLEEKQTNITKQFQRVFGYAFLITEDNYCSELLMSFINLGEMLGFTWEQIEQAYYDKNKINHERQSNGY